MKMGCWGAYESLALDIFKNKFDRNNIDEVGPALGSGCTGWPLEVLSNTMMLWHWEIKWLLSEIPPGSLGQTLALNFFAVNCKLYVFLSLCGHTKTAAHNLHSAFNITTAEKPCSPP